MVSTFDRLLGPLKPHIVEAASDTGQEQSTVDVEFNISFDEVDGVEGGTDRISEFQEDDLVKEAFSKGVDLRKYAKDVDDELKDLEKSHIQDYVQTRHDLGDLLTQLKSCDSLLGNMESLLEGFQVDLDKISKEIQTLQGQSHSLNIKLKNRLTAQTDLNNVLEGIVVSPELIIKICEGEVNEFFLLHLVDLNKKMAYVKSQKGKHIRGLKDVGPEMERLRLKASEKIRDFLLKKIEALKAPNTNITIIQQNILLKFKELYWFLLERYSEASVEIRANYCVTVSAYFFASFEKYLKSMSKVQVHKAVIADKLDLIGAEESSKRGLFTSKTALKDRTNVFTLGDRIQVLQTSDPGIILAHIAEEQHLKFPYEVIFKSTNRLLMDNASSEYIFTTEFFFPPRKRLATKAMADMGGVINTGAVFSDIFDATMKLMQAFVKQYVENSFDAVGILICIRLNSHNARIMQKRRIPCLENYMNAINMLFWPRFQTIIDMHIESLKKVGTGRFSLNRDAHPHYITRRYAEFAASVLTLNESFDDALLTNSLLRLRSEVENLLQRMSGDIGDEKSRIVMLINNYDLVVTILSEYTASSLEGEKAYFDAILEGKIADYVEEELKPVLGYLVEFVTRAELEKNVDVLDTDRFERIASEFNNSWKATISTLNTTIGQAFPNFKNGARILHSVLTQMLLYYKRFMILWEKRFTGKGRRVHPVGIQTVMAEIKKMWRAGHERLISEMAQKHSLLRQYHQEDIPEMEEEANEGSQPSWWRAASKAVVLESE
ncbi:Vacuolar protein sorting-associated protein 52 [Dinochytrium kinnereticum]|nr:Vacuolar protein sorting-associated protein 52 [Dinochytrium kinnereticum]